MELYRLSIEVLNKRSRSSAEPSRRLALFGVVEYLGEFSEDFLINMLSSIFSKDSLARLMHKFKERRVIRIRVSGKNLLKMFKSLKIKLEENLLEEYEYVLVLEPVAAS